MKSEDSELDPGSQTVDSELCLRDGFVFLQYLEKSHKRAMPAPTRNTIGSKLSDLVAVLFSPNTCQGAKPLQKDNSQVSHL